jgi:hypothetical protein
MRQPKADSCFRMSRVDWKDGGVPPVALKALSTAAAPATVARSTPR